MGRPTSRTRPTLGESVARARQGAGFTQAQVAAKLGVTQRIVTYWEREAESIQAEYLVRLADLYQVTVDQLVGYEAPADTRLRAILALADALSADEKQRLRQALKRAKRS